MGKYRITVEENVRNSYNIEADDAFVCNDVVTFVNISNDEEEDVQNVFSIPVSRCVYWQKIKEEVVEKEPEAVVEEPKE